MEIHLKTVEKLKYGRTMSLRISENANKNYLCKIVELKGLRKHSNADKLQVVTVDFQNVITGMDAKDGDIYVYFPLECAINKDFLSWSNSFEDKEMNSDKEVKGFFNKHGRVRAIKLRGEPSQGYIIPVGVLQQWLQYTTGDFTDKGSEPKGVGTEFDYWDDIKICEKYIPRTQIRGEQRQKQAKIPRISRLVENQFRLHNDTENLRKNVDKLNPVDYIGIHYKKHGTSFVVGNILVKRKLSWVEKLLKRFKINIEDTEYDYVYSSRKVVKNEFETRNAGDYYGYDLWKDIKDEIKDKIPKGYTLYGECLGYTKDGGWIQKDYDYGCKPSENKIYIYRITVTNTDGFVIELDDRQIYDFCEKYGLNYKDTFLDYGKVMDIYPELDILNNLSTWKESFIKRLEQDYNEKDCYMCKTKVPEEGIVVRKQSLFGYEAYKLKSFRFFEKETKELDNGTVDIESQQTEENAGN